MTKKKKPSPCFILTVALKISISIKKCDRFKGVTLSNQCSGMRFVWKEDGEGVYRVVTQGGGEEEIMKPSLLVPTGEPVFYLKIILLKVDLSSECFSTSVCLF